MKIVTKNTKKPSDQKFSDTPPVEATIASVIDEPHISSRPKRTRKPVNRLAYDYLGQTKLHRACQNSYQEKLEAGRRLWERWKSPEMASTRRKVCLRLASQ